MLAKKKSFLGELSVGAGIPDSWPHFRIGISPLSWTNDVLEDLGGNIPLETRLSQAAGIFTVPGDRIVCFGPVAEFVRSSGYAGWLVVEVEQDPVAAPPLPTVKRARTFVDSLFADAPVD